MNKIDKGISAFIRWMSYIGIAALLFIMFATVIDILLRLFLNETIPGVIELVELAMVVVVWLGLPLCALNGEMIVVDIFTFPRWYNDLLKIISFVSCIIASRCVIIQSLAQKKIIARTATLGIVKYPFMWITAAGFALMAIAVALSYYRDLKARKLEKTGEGADKK